MAAMPRTAESIVPAWVCLLCDHPPIRIGTLMMDHLDTVHPDRPGGCESYNSDHQQIRDFRLGVLVNGTATKHDFIPREEHRP